MFLCLYPKCNDDVIAANTTEGGIVGTVGGGGVRGTGYRLVARLNIELHPYNLCIIHYMYIITH